MLGAGEQLCKLATTVEQLFDCSVKDLHEWDNILHIDLGVHTMAVFTLLPRNGDIVSLLWLCRERGQGGEARE